MEQTKIMNKNISISETNSTNWLNRDDQFDNKQNVKEEYEGEARQWNQSHKHLLKLDNDGGTTYQLMSQRQKLERLAGKSQGTLSVRRLLPRVDLVNVASVLKLRSACVSCGIRDQTPAEGLVITLQFLWVMSSDSGIQMPSTGEMSVFTGTLDIGGPSPLDMEYFDQDYLHPAIGCWHSAWHSAWHTTRGYLDTVSVYIQTSVRYSHCVYNLLSRQRLGWASCAPCAVWCWTFSRHALGPAGYRNFHTSDPASQSACHLFAVLFSLASALGGRSWPRLVRQPWCEGPRWSPLASGTCVWRLARVDRTVTLGLGYLCVCVAVSTWTIPSLLAVC